FANTSYANFLRLMLIAIDRADATFFPLHHARVVLLNVDDQIIVLFFHPLFYIQQNHICTCKTDCRFPSHWPFSTGMSEERERVKSFDFSLSMPLLHGRDLSR